VLRKNDVPCGLASTPCKQPFDNRSEKLSSTRDTSIDSLQETPVSTSNNVDTTLLPAANLASSSQSLPDSSSHSSSPRSNSSGPAGSSHAAPTEDRLAAPKQGLARTEPHNASHAVLPVSIPPGRTLCCNTFIDALKPASSDHRYCTPRRERTSSGPTGIAAAMARGAFLEAPRNPSNTFSNTGERSGSNSISAAMARGPISAARWSSGRSSRSKGKVRVRQNTKVCVFGMAS
jgi:hypothetical protein